MQTVIKDLPTLVMALESSFNETNNLLGKYMRNMPTNFKVIEVDSFYKDIPQTVSTKTIHPSVYGSEVMAEILHERLCE